jgi:Leucine-rich repeat (LRR) protein
MRPFYISIWGTFFLVALHSPPPLKAQPAGSQFGEIRVRVFRSVQDSLQFQQIEKQLDEELTHKPLRQKKLDSLMKLQTTIFTEGIVFKTIYHPSRNYILTDSLRPDTDLAAVRRICVYKKSELPAIVYQCKNLEALELVNTSIRKLPGLKGLTMLKSIYIYNNQIKRPMRLAGNSTVSTLTIHNQRPDGVPRSFRKFANLQTLDLAENGLTQFPNGARHNKKLTELSLQRNNITLKKRIKEHRYIERISLHNNAIEYVPASIGNCRNLKKLNFNSNRISEVHPDIAKLQKLQQLSFYRNSLQSVPDGVYKIRTLKEIDLFYNQIEDIDPQFANWQNITTLYLSHNKIVALPENIDTLRLLEGLHIWDNRLGKLPRSLGKITGLKYLRVNGNYLKEIPLSVLALTNLEEIDLSHNYLQQLPDEIFHFPRLKILAIVNNPWDDKTLESLPAKAAALKAKDVFVHLSDQ